jgi:6,7-dimethyl-8-ribityllumazine synthase
MSKATPRISAKSASGARYAIVKASFNAVFTGRLLKNCRARLKALGVKRGSIDSYEVPGAFELALAAQALALTGRYAAVICLGAVIRGETSHYDYVCSEAARGINLAGLKSGIPVVFGVLTCDNEVQAYARCQGGPKDAGIHAANTAVAMGKLIKRIANSQS